MLYPHQVEAIKWMKNTEDQPRLYEMQPRGGILAHEMGLGKTVTMLTHMLSSDGANLVVCPKSVLTHWMYEAEHRVGFSSNELFLYYGSNRKPLGHGGEALELPAEARLVLTTFDIVRTESNHKKQSLLFTTVWKRIVLDEAHRIAERNSKTSKSISQLKGFNRWCLTGTPYKNGLSDIVALCKFLKIQPYSKATWWKHNAHHDLSLKQWRALYLHIRYKSTSFLAPLKVKNSALSPTLLEQRLQHTVKTMQVSCDNKSKLQEFELLKILRLRQAAVHPLLFLSDEARDYLLQNAPCAAPEQCAACSRSVHKTLLEDVAAVDMENNIDSIQLELEDADAVMSTAVPGGKCTPGGEWKEEKEEPWSINFEKGTTILKCTQHTLCSKCTLNTLVCPACIGEGMQQEVCDGWLHSSKTLELLRILKKSVAKQQKVVVFSQWTSCLDLVQVMLRHYQVEHCRFDGTVSTLEERSSIVDQFAGSDRMFVMLTSLGAGAEGINLTCANTVVLMEPYWNASIEKQAIDRVHRLGQKKVVRVHKLTLNDSVEDWIISLQKLKEQELEFYLKGTTPIVPQIQPDSSALGKRQQRLIDKTTGGGSLGGTWKKTSKCATSTTQKNMLSAFIY